jgi:hypothetical protein
MRGYLTILQFIDRRKNIKRLKQSGWTMADQQLSEKKK